MNRKQQGPNQKRPAHQQQNSNNNNVRNQQQNQNYQRQNQHSVDGRSPQIQQKSKINNVYSNQQQQFLPLDKNSINQQSISSISQSQFNIQDQAFDAINNAIHEFLLKKHFLRTLDIFQEELVALSSQSHKQSAQKDDLTYDVQIITTFEQGNKELFFQKWNKYIPINIRQYDDNACKLEFYLQMYFLIYPIMFKKGSKFDKASVASFKNYLDTKGSELSKTNEFLPYYALPYIKNPIEHPAIKHIFTKEWILDLRNKLIDFIQTLYNNDGVPVLYDMYYTYLKKINGVSPTASNLIDKDVQQYINYINRLEQNNKELLKVIQEYNNKYNTLQQNYRNFAENAKTNLMESQTKWTALANELVQISKSLIGNCESLKNNQQVDEKLFQYNLNKILKYENFLSSNYEELIAQSKEVSVFDKQSTMGLSDNNLNNNIAINGLQNPLNKEQQGNNIFIGENEKNEKLNEKLALLQNHYSKLDYNKIRTLFLSPNQNKEQLCALLQALRWRITKTKSAVLRRDVIVSYANFDILGLVNNENQIIIENLLSTEDQNIIEFSLRFINSMASDFYGRSYLVLSDRLVKILIDILKRQDTDSLTRRNALGSLQKLSLRRRPQIIMIENDLIGWITKVLKNEKETLSEYSYEYATALLMNLALRSAGKIKCEDPSCEILEVLNDLLEHENMQVRTFVNGTLYSLFFKSSIREQAKAMGLVEILQYLLENSDERFKKQIQYIMDQLNDDLNNEDAISDSNEEDTDIDDLDEDEEIDDEDDQEQQQLDENGLQGEELLNNHYTLLENQSYKHDKQGDQQKDQLDKKEKQFSSQSQNLDKDNPFNRALTPSMLVASHNNLSYNKINAISFSQEDEETQNQVQDKLLPEELRSRPKLLRTPAGGDRSQIVQKIQQIQKQTNQENITESAYMSEKKVELRKLAEQSDEHKNAFISRPKVPRTPPLEKQRNRQQQQQLIQN